MRRRANRRLARVVADPGGGTALAEVLLVMDLSSLLWALVGGALIGTSASLMLYFNGQVTGISGIVGGLLAPAQRSASWRWLFVLGLVVGGAVMVVVRPAAFATAGTPSIGVTLLAGLLVGVGTRVGSGCTSGHGVCGMSRLSPRSITATITFIVAGVVTVAIRAVGGAA